MFPFGVTFYPDQWPKETWDESFRQIKAVGFNCVRFNEMSWDLIEPQPGKFNFKDLDLALDLCKKHGLKVLLGIPTSQVPPWFHSRFKNSRPVAQDGTLYPEYGPRPNICKDNKNYQRLATRLAQKIVTRYKNHPALMMWCSCMERALLDTFLLKNMVCPMNLTLLDWEWLIAVWQSSIQRSWRHWAWPASTACRFIPSPAFSFGMAESTAFLWSRSKRC